jgi:hypothetical protein
VNYSPLAWSTSQGTGLPHRDTVPGHKRDSTVTTLYPYRPGPTWVFDDPITGLKQEAFVLGTSEMISVLVAAKGLADPDGGFALRFSDQPFDGFDAELSWLRSDEVRGFPGMAPLVAGNWYTGVIAGERMEGWLCPALLRYFPAAPARIFVRADPLPPGVDPVWHVTPGDLPPRRFVAAPG